jgi:hypothetical protein
MNLLSVAGFLITAPVVFLVSSLGWTASSPTRVTIHVPSKSLSIMPYYFGKDKGFFAPELVEPQLVMMSPPTAIAALVGRAGFFLDDGRRDFGDYARAFAQEIFLRPGRTGPRAAGAALDQIDPGFKR